jgi:tRNA threonylcarbamoyladenosine biosynthesis protein TsaE
MVGQYQARITLYHIDLYRIDTPDEVHDLGLDEYLYAEGLCVVEWADKALALLPRDHLKIRIERVDGMTRRLEISGSAPAYDEVLDAIRSNVTGT